MEFGLKQFKSYKNSLYRIKSDIKRFFLLLSIDMLIGENIIFKSVFITILIIFLNFTAFVCARMITLNVIGAIFGIIWGAIKRSIGFCIMIGFYFFASLYYSVILDDGIFSYSYYYVGILSTIHLPLVVFVINVPGHYSWMTRIHHALMVIQAFISDYLMRNTILRNSDLSFKKYMISTAFTLACFILFYYTIVYRLLII